MVAGAPSSAVLDASALLAYLFGEPGRATVRASMPGSQMSSVNWSETVQKTAARGRSARERRAELADMGLTIVPFGVDDAEAAADLWRPGQDLSFADRACLALGQRLRLPVLTGDRAWASLDLDVEIQLIR
jgi:ribonuclease VapC